MKHKYKIIDPNEIVPIDGSVQYTMWNTDYFEFKLCINCKILLLKKKAYST